MKFPRHFLKTLALSILVSTTCHAVQIGAEVTGSNNPTTTTDQSQTIQNGDFEIFRGNPIPFGDRGHLIGDGINEFTRWNFDFTQDPNFFLFDSAKPLTSAELLIRLIPKGSDFSSDFVRIDGLPNMSLSGLAPIFIVNMPLEIHIDLLTLHSSSILLGIFNSGAGVIAMRYEDDAILSYAKLTLSNSIPEPSTYLLLVLCLVILTGTKKFNLVKTN